MRYLERGTEVPPVAVGDALTHAREFRAAQQGGEIPLGHFRNYPHGNRQTIRVSWGHQNLYFSYASITSITEFAKPEELDELPLFQGWIFQYRLHLNSWAELANLERDGWTAFWQTHDYLKNLTRPKHG